MLNYKAVISKIEKLNPLFLRAHVLPADFGSMYLLYPSENDSLASGTEVGMLDRMMDSVRLRWKRAREIRYYKQNSIY